MTKTASARRKSVLPTRPKRTVKSTTPVPTPISAPLPEANAKPAASRGSKSPGKPLGATATLLANAKAAAPVTAKPASGARGKLGEVETLLRRKTGATLAELMTTTDWQAHTVRGVISGALRKRKGFTVEATRENGISRYRIVA